MAPSPENLLAGGILSVQCSAGFCLRILRQGDGVMSMMKMAVGASLVMGFVLAKIDITGWLMSTEFLQAFASAISGLFIGLFNALFLGGAPPA